jgi:hypothetical protein
MKPTIHFSTVFFFIASLFSSYSTAQVNNSADILPNQPANFELVEKQALIKYVVETNPDAAAKVFTDFIDAVDQSMNEAYRISRQQKLGLIDSGVRKLAIVRNQQIDRARQSIKESLFQLKVQIENKDTESLILFYQTRVDLLFLLQESASAMMERLPSVESYSEVISVWVHSYIENQSEHKKFIRNHFPHIRDVMDQATSERVYKVWVNRENVQLAAVSALLVAQGACIVMSAGICAATLPLTQSLTVKGAITGIQSAASITYGTINLIDRYRAEGAIGLLSLGAVLDTLLIVSALPGPSKALLSNGYHVLSPSVFRAIATTQYQAGMTAGVMLTGYGSWQLLRAEIIAEDLNRQGISTTPEEIRRQGVMNLIFGGSAISQSRQRAEAWKNGSQVEQQLYESSKVSKALARMADRGKTTLLPIKGIKQLGSQAGALGSRLGSVGQKLFSGSSSTALSIGQTLKSMFQVGYTALFYHAAAVFSVSLPDFAFDKNIELPNLAEGEISLTLNGFDPSDILYHAFESEHARRRELEKYKLVNQYYYDTFSSADNLFEKIALYGRKGKIKYLRIMAHGIPGKIATRAMDIEGAADAYIDVEYLTENFNEIRDIARLSMAPMATMQITSCLVGANLDEPIEALGETIEKNAGDKFVNTIGHTLFVNGGTLHTSRRIIMALDATYGTVGSLVIDSGPKMSTTTLLDNKMRFEISNVINSLKLDIAAINQKQKFLQMQLDKPAEELSAEEKLNAWVLLKTNADRLISTYSKIWSIVNRYGLKIEGPLFGASRSRIDHFPAEL